MARDYKIKARIEAEDKASPAFQKAEKSARGFSGFLKKNFVAAAAAAATALYGLSRAVGSWVGSMLKAETANAALRVALKKTDDATKENIKAFKAQANAIQESTRYTADSITQTQAFLKQLGVSAAQLQLATQATIDLSESFGLDLTSAARNVGKTVGGFAGELGELIPELKNLDAEALKAGKGIELLAEKFRGAAAAAADTLEVRLQQLNNELSDLGKAFAEGAAGQGDFKDAVKGGADAAREFNEEARLMGGILRELVGGTIQKARDLGTGIGTVYAKVTAPAIAKVATSSEALRKQLLFQVEAMNQSKTATELQAGVMKELEKSYGGAAKQLEALLGLSDRNARVNDEAAERQKRVTGALKEMGVALETEVNDQIEANNKLLEDAQMLYDQRIRQNGELVVSHGDLARIEAEVIAKNAELTGSLVEQTSATGDAATGLDDLSGKLAGYRGVVDETTQSLAAFTDQQARANAAGAAGSETFGGTLSGGSKLFPNSALANTARRGGIAIDVRAKSVYN